MTTYYVDSASGSNTAPYDTWAKAATSLNTIAGINVAGDVAYVASTHSESVAGAISYAWAGTRTQPTRIICADKTSGAPPATLATGATITSTGSNGISFGSTGAFFYLYGLTFVMGSGGSGSMTLTDGSGGAAVLEQCSLQIAATGGSEYIDLQAGRMVDCTVKFAAAGQKILPKGAYVTIDGLTLLAGGTSPTRFFGTYLPSLCRNLDLSNASTTMTIVQAAVDSWPARISYIKVPGGWTGQFNSGSPYSVAAQQTAEYIDSGGTNYSMRGTSGYGNMTVDVSTYRVGGATDGTNPFSWNVLGSTTIYPHGPFYTPDILYWNDTVGSPKTLTVEITSVFTAPKNDEMWLEVQYFSSSGSPLGSRVTTARGLLAASAATTTSTASWNNPGAVKKKFSVTITPQQKGFFVARVALAKAISTWVDPYITVT